MSLTLNTNENNIIKFNIGVSGTSSLPSKVRVFVGGTDKKLCFIAKATGIEKEWCAEIPPLTELLNYTSGPLFCSIEIVVNGRTFTPYSKEVNLVEPQQEPIEQTVEVKPEETIDTTRITIPPVEKTEEEPAYVEPELKENVDVQFISHYEKDNVKYSLWYKGQNWHELTYSTGTNKSLKFVKDWHNKSKEEIHKELTQDGYNLINEEVKPEIKVKPLLKDIASVVEPVKVVKEEKAKPKKTFKLKPFNNAKKSKVKSDNKSMKDILVIEDIDLSKISIPTPIIQKNGNSIPFKLTKKNVVYR